jgi:hypothetical protein
VATETEALKKRIKEYGSWKDKADMDRFVILVFLTAAEKRAFVKKQFGDELVDYFDGDDVASIQLKQR